MAQFAVICKEDEKASLAITGAYPSDSIKAWPGLWFVSDEAATAQQVSTKLGTANGGMGTVIVLSISGYHGFAPKNIWEWLAVKGTPKHGTST
jgi:hypothetical protein